ncbi:M28 family peptidase [Chitinophaga pendula]|uniref:M28 family metallopeptidase n=1 Tax=Chitinophaga TaxID=79328 RepID=UPI000BB058A8|nr:MULTISPECIES: M28 family peptidase [Chitinophaga]ASZ15002.1 peptidase M28 [Chitinophaga sp. MD30]UCJ09644.1 M28 family peptidase [Chitinophaga pendula]
MMRQLSITLATLLVSLTGITQSKKPIDAIRQADIKQDLYDLADDHFRGREAGTLDELKAAAWLAEQARKAGLEPAGDDGTYFQYFPMIRERVSSRSSLSIGNRSFKLWQDAIVYEPTFADIDAPIVFIQQADTVSAATIRGKVVALPFSPRGISDPRIHIPMRYVGIVVNYWVRRLAEKGAVGIIFISDDLAAQHWSKATQYNSRGSYQIEGSLFHRQLLTGVPIIWLQQDALPLVQATGQQLYAHLFSETFSYPSVNVVAKVKGSDPRMSKEYVVFSGHTDHDGVRNVVGVADSIYNGADDNATVCAALLAIGRAFHRQPGKRSALFIWHGAEERGLFGSTWYADHPTVPRESLVAVLNADMIGNNAPDSAALLGLLPPHLSSSTLAKIGLEANNKGPRFKLDTTWDKAMHPEGWYFRSDHFPYAKKNIPVLYFSSLPHALYHTPADEASTINIEKLTKFARWMYATGFTVANMPERPALEKGFKLER